VNLGTDSVKLVKGITHQINYPFLVGLIIRFIKLAGIDLPISGDDIRTELILETQKEFNDRTFWQRKFYYPNGKVVNLKSFYVANSDGVTEHFKLNGSLEMAIEQFAEGILYHGQSIILDWGIKIPIPQLLSLGKLTVTEKAVSETEYEIIFEFKHPLFGTTYYFSGTYELIKDES
jgi:hypothetical protein